MVDPFASLDALGFGSWARHPLQGDASTRQFVRLAARDGETAIAMRTPSDQANSEASFLSITQLLRDHGICAPRIVAQDNSTGVLVLEDLGKTDIAMALNHNSTGEFEMYRAAIDVLTLVQGIPPPQNLVQLSPDVGGQMLDPFFEFFVPKIATAQRHDVITGMTNVMASALTGPLCLSLRDYHAQNLIWRAKKDGSDRIGVLDFQDAFLAPPEYDLVSLLRDARRDVSDMTRSKAMAYFAQKTQKPSADVATRCAVLGVQRNLRILGIFSRLAKRDGKPGYMGLMPRVRAHILDDLAHPVMGPLRNTLTTLLDARSR